MSDREAMAQDLHDNAPQGLIDFLDAHDIAADVWFLNYAEALDGWTRQPGVSVPKSRCPQCKSSVFISRAQHQNNPNDPIVWCKDMGHWTGRLSECEPAE